MKRFSTGLLTGLLIGLLLAGTTMVLADQPNQTYYQRPGDTM